MSKRELSEVAKELIAARRRIESPDNWLQERLYDGHGRFCAVGALTGGDISRACQMQLLKAAGRLFGVSHVCVNDYLGHKAVMEMYDLAIAMEIQMVNT